MGCSYYKNRARLEITKLSKQSRPLRQDQEKYEMTVSNRLPASKASGSNLLAKDFTQREDWAPKGLTEALRSKRRGSGCWILAPGFLRPNVQLLAQLSCAASCREFNPIAIQSIHVTQLYGQVLMKSTISGPIESSPVFRCTASERWL